MGRRILIKLRSREGASLIFALLAFLICAVISAVLLASASASAGRLSGLAKADQRYYAVTSAAQLFCDTLDGQSFTFEQTKTRKKTAVTNYVLMDGVYRINGTDSTENDKPDGLLLKVQAPFAPFNGGPLEINNTDHKLNTKASMLTQAAVYYVFGDTSTSTDYAITDTFVGKTFQTTSHTHNNYPSWDLTFSVTGENDLTVKVLGRMLSNGDIELTFENLSADDPDKYSMIVTLKAEVSDSPVETTPERIVGSSTTSSADGVTYSTTVVTEYDYVKTTVITWRVSEIKKVSA